MTINASIKPAIVAPELFLPERVARSERKHRVVDVPYPESSPD